MKKILLLLAVILATTIGAYSQAPGIFNYQGVARNSVGNVLINQSITLRLTIHDATPGGAVVYQEVRAAITNPFGLFNVQVGSPGFISQVGTVAGVPWGVGNKYIQVEIDPAGGSTFRNIGTAQIASVPYALFSTTAGDLVLPYLKTQADAGTLFRINNSGTGISGAIMGTTLSPAANAWGVHGQVNNTSAGGFSSGVLGTNLSTTGLGIGVTGTQNGSGWGVYGTTPSGIGVNGASTSGFGVNGSSVTGTGGFFSTTSGVALNSAGALRHTGIGEGAPLPPNTFKILAGDPVGNATWQHASAIGLVSGSGTLNFVPKWTPDGTTLGNSQIFDNGTNVGIATITATNKLEVIQSGATSAVLGSRTAVTGTAAGVTGTSASQDANAVGTQGTITSTTPGGFSAGLRGINNGTGGLGIGVYGSQAGSGWGVYGTTPNGIAVHGNSAAGFGMYGLSTTGVGVYGLSTNGESGRFEITNNASTSNALTGITNGTGYGILGQHTAATGTNAGVRGESNSQDASANAVIGVITSTTPGGFSAALRGVNNGTGGLGIGVYGSQNGSGWGVYGVTPNGIGVYGNSTAGGFGVYGNSNTGTGIYGTSTTGNASQFEITNSASTGDAIRANQFGLGRAVYATISNATNIVAAVRGETNGGGYGLFGQATGNGNAGFFQVSNPASTSSTVNVTTNGIGSGVTIQLTNASNGARGVDVLQTGVGPGVFATSAGGNAVWGITSSISAAGVIGDNTFGEAVVGRNRGGNGVGAVVGRNDSTGYGVRGFNTLDGIGVLGQAGISGGTGRAGRFEIVNAANTNNSVEIATNGLGGGLNVQLTNAASGARGIDVNVTGVGTAGFAVSAGGTGWWGITSSISAAGILGDNTFGEAVVGRNRGGLGVGAVVGRNDSSGYGIRGFNTKDGIGALGQAGISGGTGIGGVFENVNAANSSVALIGRTNGTGAAFLANNTNGGATDIAIFQKGGTNVARIDGTGKGFFNNGTQVGGADVAEYFDVEGLRSCYEAGDVLVISQNSDRRVEKSSTAYSTLVSGVYATKPGLSLTERNAEADQLEDMVPMGVIGVIPTKVCTEGGAIKRGDLLVTSSIPGVAMKADLEKVKVGQVLGKALQDYYGTEVGKINVLVSVK